MLELIIFILATIGMSHIIVDGSIFNSFKTWLGKESEYSFLTWGKNKLLSLMNCHVCSGFWSGAFIALLLWFCECDPLDSQWKWPLLFVYACAGSFLSMFAANIVVFLQAQSLEK